MKIHQGINYSMSMIGIFCALISSQVDAGAMGPAVICPSGKAYIGIFGGAGESTKTDISQFGTAFYTEANGGPLAVNAFGRARNRTAGFIGGQVGYQWPETRLNAFNSLSGLVPAIELEGYYLGKSTFTGHDVNNDTVRLPEHDFVVRYPMKAGVFLTNAIANFNLSNFSRLHPYIGAGIGAGVLSISNATATQISPPEPGINHYNAHTNDKDATFAAQGKLGVNFDLSSCVSVLVEYRGLYLANSKYALGSTVYPGHPATSHWLVKLDSQYYNMGAIGVQYHI